MPTIMFLGGQWGDEGKGKILDWAASRYSPALGIRFNGGANASHSIRNTNGKVVLHTIPSTIFQPDTISIIGNGVVIDPVGFVQEMVELKQLGVDYSNMRISDRAHLVMPWHKAWEKAQEESRGQNKIGTTGRGIGPCYADAVGRNGIRIVDTCLGLDSMNLMLRSSFQNAKLLRAHYLAKAGFLQEVWLRFLDQVFGSLHIQKRALDIGLPYLADFMMQDLVPFKEHIRDYIASTEHIVARAQQKKELIFVEGAQGTLLDREWGFYPMVTSSTTTRLGVYQGCGLKPAEDELVLLIMKGYVTRVGEGSFPTELTGRTGEHLREAGGEYGATTGRPRRCGWFDACLARYAAAVNGAHGLVLTKLDVLDSSPKIKIGVDYEFHGLRVIDPPVSNVELGYCKPIYEEMEGWLTTTTNIRCWKDLPRQFKEYVKRLEDLIGVPVYIISNGPEREQIIELKPILSKNYSRTAAV